MFLRIGTSSSPCSKRIKEASIAQKAAKAEERLFDDLIQIGLYSKDHHKVHQAARQLVRSVPMTNSKDWISIKRILRRLNSMSQQAA